MTSRPDRSAEILLVEDNPDDIDLTLEALRESHSTHHLNVVENGTDALAFLRRHGTYAAAPRPDLVLLDLNLPMISGYEVLTAIKTDPALRRIPVVILTSSAAEADRSRSTELGADGYVTKPADLDDFLRVVAAIDRFCRPANTAT
jgi:two-component system, chemotaxis family, response regulator Rcp1